MNNDYKSIIWIDDDRIKVKKLINTVFKKLWTDKIVNYIVYIGDYYTQDYSNNFDKTSKKATFIYDTFDALSEAYGTWCNDNIEVTKTESPVSYYKKTFKNFIDEKYVCIPDVNDSQPTSIIETIKSCIGDINCNDYIIALDVRLFEKDYEKVMKGETIASIKYYKELLKKHYSCYLYSSYRYDQPFIKKWNELAGNEGEIVPSYLLFDIIDYKSSFSHNESEEARKAYSHLKSLCEKRGDSKNENNDKE